MSKINKFIGAHVSAQGGVSNAIENAKNINARAFAIFTKIKEDGIQNH